MNIGPIVDALSEAVELIDAYHRALGERGGPATHSTAEELAIRHGRLLIAMRCETPFTGFEQPEAVAA